MEGYVCMNAQWVMPTILVACGLLIALIWWVYERGYREGVIDLYHSDQERQSEEDHDQMVESQGWKALAAYEIMSHSEEDALPSDKYMTGYDYWLDDPYYDDPHEDDLPD